MACGLVVGPSLMECRLYSGIRQWNVGLQKIRGEG